MTGLEAGLLVAGCVCFLISFFLSEKLSQSDISEFENLSRQEVDIIVERQLKNADEGIKVMIDEGMKDAMEEFDDKADRLLNNKIMAISDYSDSVLSSIDKSNKEIVFMYNMLIEKQEALTEITKDIQLLESNLREIKFNLEQAAANGDFLPIEQGISVIDEAPYIERVEEIELPPMDDELSREVNIGEDKRNQNDQILKMHSEGFTELEIAKRLGRGLGEIKLVLGLFNRD